VADVHAVTTAMLVLMIVRDSPTPTAEDAPAAAFDALISPELALVDPDLARRARARLASTEAPPSPVPPIRRAAESAPARAATSTAPPVPAATPTTPPALTRRAVAEPPRATVAPRPARAPRFRPRTAVYRWIVSPGFGPRTSARYGQPAVASAWQADR
jgi:hypothetical protein